MRSHFSLTRHVAAFTVLGSLALAGCVSGGPARSVQLASADAAARAALAQESAINVSRLSPRTISVLPFRTAPGDTILEPLRFALPALLMTDLSVSPALQLIERLNSDALLRELSLLDAGVVDPQTAPRVGRLLGAGRLLIGELSRPTPGTLRLSARLVDVARGTVTELVNADAPLVRVLDAEKALALQLFDQLGVALTPAQRARVAQQQPVQLAALVAYGRGVDAEAHADLPRAQQAFAQAVQLSPALASATAPRVAAGPVRLSAFTSLERVIAQGTTAINAPVITRLPEASDAPLAPGTLLSIGFLFRITP